MLKDFNAELQKADAIREVRARGVTVPGVAELIVEYHGALHVLQNLDSTQALGEALAKDPDSELGVKMRGLLAEAATKEVKAEPVPVIDLTERAVQHVMKAGYSEEAARQIVAEHGAETVLAGEETSKPAGSPSAAGAGNGTEAGSASDAAAGTSESGAAAGSSPKAEAVDPTSAA